MKRNRTVLLLLSPPRVNTGNMPLKYFPAPRLTTPTLVIVYSWYPQCYLSYFEQTPRKYVSTCHHADSHAYTFLKLLPIFFSRSNLLRIMFKPCYSSSVRRLWNYFPRMVLLLMICLVVRMSKWRRMRWAGHVACMGGKRSTVGWKEPVRKLRRRQDLRVIGWRCRLNLSSSG
jgi:hypothetical protein